VITLGELRKGVDRLARGRRRERLEQWLTSELLDRRVHGLQVVTRNVAHFRYLGVAVVSYLGVAVVSPWRV